MKKFIKYFFLVVLFVLTIYYFYPETKFPANIAVDKIVVLKSKRQLQTFSNGHLVKTYAISLGRSPVGDKEFEGDNRTPEGLYEINDKNPNSDFHKNLGVSYPNSDDIKKAKKTGRQTGGDIKIHGLKNGLGFIGKFQRWRDWTAGCMALTNSDIDELFDHVKNGTLIEIRP